MQSPPENDSDVASSTPMALTETDKAHGGEAADLVNALSAVTYTRGEVDARGGVRTRTDHRCSWCRGTGHSVLTCTNKPKHTGTESEDDIVKKGSPFFFDKDSTDDPWERAFLVFYEEFRADVRRAIFREPLIRRLVFDVVELTKASTQRTGRRQTTLREAAMRLATDVQFMTAAVLSEPT